MKVLHPRGMQCGRSKNACIVPKALSQAVGVDLRTSKFLCALFIIINADRHMAGYLTSLVTL